jgi:predicted 3-demethylubiquinone-9 3-methyltransferase (glyoxalase superfamily)
MVAAQERRPLERCHTMDGITACLWFDSNADEAVDYYCSIFANSRRVTDARYGADAPREEGTTMVVQFELDGHPFMAINGGSVFSFTPAISFVVTCADQAELDRYWDRLVDGGSPMQCGWLTDRFGVSWQIVPRRLGELMSEVDAEAGARVMQAMLKMVKRDIIGLEAAAAG